MNLALLFEPLRGDWLPEPDAPAAAGTLAGRVALFRPGAFPAGWAEADVALLGVADRRGASAEYADFWAETDGLADDTAGPDAIRRRFYDLTAGTGAWRLVDLGNLRPGPTPDDTHHRLAEVVDLLLHHGVLPIILGGDHSLTLGQHAGYEFRPDAPAVRGAVIDRAFDLADAGPLTRTWLRQLLLRDPNHLLTLSHLGHQRYHVTAAESAALEKMYFDVLRLGQLHADPREAEPLLRAADWLSVDLGAVAHPALPGGGAPPSPFGLTAEQLCRLAWYAGLSRHLTSAGFYGYDPTLDPLGLGAMAVATAAWYLIEGYYHRPAQGPADDSAAYERYDVTLAGSHERLTFYQHQQTEQWWILVEPPAAPAHLLPCSEDDYLTAARGEIPHRWVQALARS